MLCSSRTAVLVLCLSCIAGRGSAQTAQLMFTVEVPEAASTTITSARPSPIVEERGLALWSGLVNDFGVGATVSNTRWTLRSITSMTALPVEDRARPTFQQVELVRPMFTSGSTSIAGGGGVRQEWDGTSVLIGRLLAGSDFASGRLQGSLVIERALSSVQRHDAADLVTSIGWARRLTNRISAGVEGIGQDLEGFWDPTEADGGAKLLVGPTIHAQSASGRWFANFTAGPVLHSTSTPRSPEVPASTLPLSARHLGIFASASWVP